MAAAGAAATGAGWCRWQRPTARGYAAASLSCRLSGQARYPAAIGYVTEAMRWLHAHPAVHGTDVDRMVIAGRSAGGWIAALVGMTGQGAVQAVIYIDGLSDSTSEEPRRYEDDPTKNPSAASAWFGGRYAEQPALWRQASPINHVSRAARRYCSS